MKKCDFVNVTHIQVFYLLCNIKIARKCAESVEEGKADMWGTGIVNIKFLLYMDKKVTMKCVIM